LTSESERAREEFFSEAQEIVEGLGRDLLALDEAQKSGHVDPDLINDVFRAVHTLKGLAGLFGATRMSSLSHKLEELLDDLRLGKVDVTAPVLDLLFLSVQLYGKLLQAEKEGRDQPMPELEKLLTQLDRGASAGSATGGGGPIIDPNLLAVLTEFEEHKLKTNIAQGNTLYRLRVRFQLATIDQGLDELKATAKPHGDIITYLPASDVDDIDSITLEILMGSRASSATLRNALHTSAWRSRSCRARAAPRLRLRRPPSPTRPCPRRMGRSPRPRLRRRRSRRATRRARCRRWGWATARRST
jgi:two-component system, chemotaxis family, sensor kinase CheA